MIRRSMAMRAGWHESWRSDLPASAVSATVLSLELRRLANPETGLLLGIVVVEVVAIVGTGQGDTKLLMDFQQAGIGDALMVETIGLHFQIEVFLSEDLLKLPGDRQRAGHVLLADEIGNLPAETARQRNQAFVMLF